MSAMLAYTDRHFKTLGDVAWLQAPVRQVQVLDFNGHIATVLVDGCAQLVKPEYLYKTEGRRGQVSPVPFGALMKISEKHNAS